MHGLIHELIHARRVPTPAVTIAEGTSDAAHPLVLPSGRGIPSGVNSSLQYDEFIVYDIRQIRIRYLVMFDFA